MGRDDKWQTSQNAWKCPFCSSDKWCRAQKTKCFECGKPKPTGKKLKLFSETSEGKLQQAEIEKRQKQGNGGGTANRDSQNAVKEATREKDKEIERLKNELRKKPGNVQRKEDEDDEEESKPSLDLEQHIKWAEEDVKAAQAKVKSRLGDAAAQKELDGYMEIRDKLRQDYRDSKDPLEQIAKKSQRQKFLKDKRQGLKDKLVEAMAERAEAEKRVDELKQTEADLVAKIDKADEDIERLKTETFTLSEKEANQAPEEVTDMVDKACKSVLVMLGDPLFAPDISAQNQKAEVEAVHKSLAATLQQLAAITKTASEGLVQKRIEAAAAAERASAEAEARRAAAAAAVQASMAAEAASKSGTPAASSTTGTVAGAGGRDLPRRIARAPLPQSHAAWGKAVHERTDDEVLATAAPGKVAKTGSGNDMDADTNVTLSGV